MIDDTASRDEDEARGDSGPWLERISVATKDAAAWMSAADNIDLTYASLERLRGNSRDHAFQLFWSNIQVLLQSIYARPPVPVVTPKFKDRRPVYRVSSEMLERVCIVSADMGDIDQTMRELRDDLAIVGRATPWVRYDSDDDEDRVHYEHVDRKDFLHGPGRKWSEVDWVARRSWLTKDEMDDRFGKAAELVNYRETKGSTDEDGKCGVWEIWCKSKDRVYWVSDSCPEILDDDAPHLKLKDFFPCPRPAFATLERGKLTPVPDMLYYKDQLDEVNSLTVRIKALSDSIKVRGFYSAGGDVGAAVERAMLLDDDEQILVPIPGMAQLMQGGGGDPIIWLPIEMLANTVTGLISLRRQVIEDIYQIIGLSDIMRGFTDSQETLGAQQLKQQNGSFRVRDKQNELVRLARDMIRIGAEIMSEEYDRKTMIDMAQMDLPTDSDIKGQVDGIKKATEQQLAALLEQAEGMEGQAEPQQIEQQFQQQQQQIVGEAEKKIGDLAKTVTVDQVMEFLKDQKLRPFVLDIETDSTIYPDEMAEKASRNEFLNAFTSAMGTVSMAVQAGPEAIALAGGVMKFALAPYRVGRELEGLIDDLVDSAPQIAERMAQQGAEGEDSGLAAAQMELAKAEMAKVESQTAANQANAQLKMQELQLKGQEAQSRAEQDQQKFMLEVEKTKGSIGETAARVEKIYAEIEKLGVDASNQTRAQDRDDVRAISDIEARQVDQAVSIEDRARNAAMSERQQEFTERSSMKGPNDE